MSAPAQLFAGFADFKFYSARLVERDLATCLNVETVPDGDNLHESVMVRMGVQFWPAGDARKTVWFFTWDTSPTTQRVLGPDIYHNFKARTFAKRDLAFTGRSVPPPAGEIRSGMDVIWVVEWNLGAFSLAHRRHIEKLATETWRMAWASADWAQAVVRNVIEAGVLMKQRLEYCVEYAKYQNKTDQAYFPLIVHGFDSAMPGQKQQYGA